MLRSLAILAVASACLPVVAPAAESDLWEIQGEYVSLKKGDASVVVLRTSDGLIEIPIKAFGSASRAAIEKLAGPGDAPAAASASLP